MFDANTARRNQRGKPLHFLVVQPEKTIVRLIAAVHIHVFERGIYVLYQERRVQVSLDFRTIRHGVPPFSEVLLRKGLC